jgi:hypothetical protein
MIFRVTVDSSSIRILSFLTVPLPMQSVTVDSCVPIRTDVAGALLLR